MYVCTDIVPNTRLTAPAAMTTSKGVRRSRIARKAAWHVTMSSDAGVLSARMTAYVLALPIISSFTWNPAKICSGNTEIAKQHTRPTASAVVADRKKARPTARLSLRALAVAIWSVVTTARAMKAMKKITLYMAALGPRAASSTRPTRETKAVSGWGREGRGGARYGVDDVDVVGHMGCARWYVVR